MRIDAIIINAFLFFGLTSIYAKKAGILNQSDMRMCVKKPDGEVKCHILGHESVDIPMAKNDCKRIDVWIQGLDDNKVENVKVCSGELIFIRAPAKKKKAQKGTSFILETRKGENRGSFIETKKGLKTQKKEEAPAFARTISVSSHEQQQYKQNRTAILGSQLFEDTRKVLFNTKKPESVQLGDITLPQKSQYDLGLLLISGKKSPVTIASRQDMPTLAKFMQKRPITFTPNETTYPTITIKIVKDDNLIVVTSTKNKKDTHSSTLDLHKLVAYLKNADNISEIKRHNNNYLFYSGFPLIVKLNLAIDTQTVKVDSITIHALYNKFWQVARGPYEKSPMEDFTARVKSEELRKHNILLE